METTGLPNGTIARKKIKSTQVQIYCSKKILFQGKDAEQVASQLLGIIIESSQLQNTSTSNKVYNFDKHNTIGSDEAGSGDYFVRLTDCAAYVFKISAEILKTIVV